MKNNLRLNVLSKNLLIALEKIAKDKKLVKLLGNNTKNPLEDNTEDKDILLKNLFIEPFNMEVPQIQKTELRIFFPEGTFDSSNTLSTSIIYFQIVIHKDLSRIIIDNEKTLREFEIMDSLINLFSKEFIKGIGYINFQGYQYGFIDKNYHMYTLMGEVFNGQ